MMMIVKMAKNGFFDLENETPRGCQMLPSLCIFMQWVRIALQAGVFNNFSASIALGDRIQILCLCPAGCKTTHNLACAHCSDAQKSRQKVVQAKQCCSFKCKISVGGFLLLKTYNFSGWDSTF